MSLRIAVAIVVVASAATSAFADDGYAYSGAARNDDSIPATVAVAQGPSASRPERVAPQGKTREQVRRELIQAYRDGLLPTNNHDYPPSPATIARNKELNQRFGPRWAADPQ